MNTYTIGQQGEPAVASDFDGDFVVAWIEHRSYFNSSVQARRYSSLGEPNSEPFQVSTYTTTNYQDPEIWSDSNGDFVVVWAEYCCKGSFHAVHGKRFSSAGSELFEFGFDDAQRPAVSGTPSGGFVVVWTNSGYGDRNVYGQVYLSGGTPVGQHFQVNSYTPGSQSQPAVTVQSNGDFVVVWTDFQDSEPSILNARRFDSNGTAIGSEFQVGSPTGFDYDPRVSSAPNGHFVVVWNQHYPKSFGDILARGFDSNGNETFAALTVGDGENPDIATAQDGTFVVTWEDSGYVYGRRFDNTGSSLGTEFLLNSGSSFSYVRPKIAADRESDFVVVWESYFKDGHYGGVFGHQLGDDEIPSL